MHDRPTAVELLEAVRQFLEEDVVPALEGTRKFHARVAANLMAVLGREWAMEERQLQEEWERLGGVLGIESARPAERTALRDQVRARTEQLCGRIRDGAADGGPWRAEVLSHVRRTVIDKLAVANPRLVAEDPGGS